MKKVFKILSLVMLILTILKIGDTYSKYFTKANTATLSQDIGKWVIKVNNMNIYSSSGESVEFDVDKFTDFSNPDAEEGAEAVSAADKISPGTEGYTDIVIDPTGTDVAVRYDIEIDLTGVSNLAIVARLEMASGENTLIRTGENTYSGIISLADVQNEEKATVRCFVKWVDDESNNETDSELGNTLNQTLSLAANVTVTQYLGEEITEYVAPEEPETP